MASYIKTLKEDNGDITYPQTLASAVFTSGGSDVETELTKYVTAEDIASTSALSPVVSTSMIQDEAVTAAKIDSDVLSGMGSYSTSEQATPFTWIDGKTIYKKTIEVNDVSSAQIYVTHGISNFGALVNAEGVMYTSGQGYQPLDRVLPSLMSTWGWGLGDVTTTRFTLFFGSGYTLSQITAWITLYYTKSS